MSCLETTTEEPVRSPPSRPPSREQHIWTRLRAHYRHHYGAKLPQRRGDRIIYQPPGSPCTTTLILQRGGHEVGDAQPAAGLHAALEWPLVGYHVCRPDRGGVEASSTRIYADPQGRFTFVEYRVDEASRCAPRARQVDSCRLPQRVKDALKQSLPLINYWSSRRWARHALCLQQLGPKECSDCRYALLCLAGGSVDDDGREQVSRCAQCGSAFASVTFIPCASTVHRLPRYPSNCPLCNPFWFDTGFRCEDWVPRVEDGCLVMVEAGPTAPGSRPGGAD